MRKIDKLRCWIPSALLKSLRYVKISPKDIINILYGSVMVQIWKDFSSGWWNVLVSAWFQVSTILKIWYCGSHFALVYAIVYEKPQMDIRESWHNYPCQYFRSFDRGIVILTVLMAPDRVVLPASRNNSHRKLLTCFLRGVALGPSIPKRERRNGQICLVRFEDNVLLTGGSRPHYFQSSQ